MSHASNARAAHMRHANRAGGPPPPGPPGFGEFSFTFGGFTFGPDDPVLGPPRTKTTTSTIATSTSAPPALTSSVVPTSSSTSSAVLSTSTTSTTTRPIPTLVSVSTTFSGTALRDNKTKLVTHVVAGTSAASSPSSSTPALVPNNALVAPVIGGLAGGIFGLAGIIFLVTFFMRRRRSSQQDAIDFNPDSFRRSAIPLADPPTHQDTVARGYNPPSPVMVERRSMYPASPNYPSSPELMSPSSGNPLVFQAPFSPITPNATTPVTGYGQGWPAPVLTRNTSASSAGSSAHEYAQRAQERPLPSPRTSLRPDEYMDLERTSVTPFQAAQYVEISKHLNTEVPKGLDTPAVAAFVKNAELPPLPPKTNPFADAEAEDDVDENTQEIEFPAPPSPVHPGASRRRVDSTPPMLPEIVVESRASSYLSDSGSSPFATGFPSGQTLVVKGSGLTDSPMGSRFPVTPSPLASSFAMPSPPAAASAFPAAPPPAAQPRPDAKQRQSVYTVYDPEDAYGGI